MSLKIIKASDQDFDEIWPIFHQIIQTGDTYVYYPHTTFDEAKEIWMKDTHAYIAKLDGKTIGTCVIRNNRYGFGSHVCNAGFMVDHNYRGRGFGRKLGEFAIKEAKKLGYHAMQFNVVVSTNTTAVSLWKSLGFKIIGTVPEGYQHQKLGLVDIYIMYRKL